MLSKGEPVRIALVGAGRMGRLHLRALERAGTVEPAAIIEPDAQARRAVAAHGWPMYEAVEQFLNDATADAALVAAPSDQHAAVVATFAAAGLPVLCEKPLGVHADDAAAASRAAEKAGIILQIGYWRRFVPELRALRERIVAGELGQILQLSCMQWDAQLPSGQFRARSGGVCVDMGVHEFDQARWLLGQEFEWVTATAAGTTSSAQEATDPDCASMLAGLSGGAAVVISLGRHFPHQDSCWLEVWGSEGYERITFMWGAAGEGVFGDCMRRQAEAFARAVGGENLEGAEGTDAVAALNVAGLAATSLAEGGAVARRPGAAR